jgi:SAM-dependent methyltransferase
MRGLLSALPEPIRTPLRRAKLWLSALSYHGSARWCPVCERSAARFRAFGNPSRIEAQCPHCLSLERHRLAWLFLARRTNLFDGRAKTMLHVAPEFCFEPRLRKRIGAEYLTADLSNFAMVRMDVERIRYPDESFDVVFCSHVLEHVNDDRRAMREFARVLKRDGWAILLVPIIAEVTYEDLSITDPAERRRLFGQEDHVRRYGPDYADRLREAGFHVTVTGVADLVSPEDAERMRLTAAAGDIYCCTRMPASRQSSP